MVFTASLAVVGSPASVGAIETSAEAGAQPNEPHTTAEPGPGLVVPQVVGGSIVENVQGPDTAVRLEMFVPGDGIFVCTGVVVSARHVLTAAHCLTDEAGNTIVSPANISIGEPIARGGAFSNVFRWTSAAAAVVHPAWPLNDATDNDIAVVTADEDLVSPRSALADQGFVDRAFLIGDPSVISNAVLSGYGTTDPNGPGDELLRRADVSASVAGPNRCLSVVAVQVLCSSPITGNACFGDSGGPLRVTDVNGRPRVIGLISAGSEDCSGFEYHVNVTQHLGWIRSITGPLPPTEPGPVSDLRTNGGFNRIDVSWSAPTSDGGAAISGIDVIVNPGGISQTLPPGTTSTSIVGLANEVVHSVEVKVRNGAGSSRGAISFATPSAQRSGYWLVDADGTVYAFGDAGPVAPSVHIGASPADAAAHPSGDGLWVLGENGSVVALGVATDFGGVPATVLGSDRAASIAATPDGFGYWVFTAAGRVHAFGSAPDLGDMSGITLNAPIIDSVATTSGMGYWMVAADGGVFTFGDAAFFGSTGALRLAQPVVAIVPDPDGAGYWLIAADGGVFSFGADFRGSLPQILAGVRLNAPIVGGTAHGDGYLLVGGDGGVFNFSDQDFLGSLGANPPSAQVVTLAAFVS